MLKFGVHSLLCIWPLPPNREASDHALGSEAACREAGKLRVEGDMGVAMKLQSLM